VGAYPIRTLTLEIGDRRPLGVGAGSLALLSNLAPAGVERVLAQNAEWLVEFPSFDAVLLRTLVSRTRDQGYAFNEGRIVAAMNAMAVMAGDGAVGPAIALSVAAIRERVNPKRRPQLLSVLRTEAERLGRSLQLSSGDQG
jgi:DNA-binding IclR family transcriptional regulator